MSPEAVDIAVEAEGPGMDILSRSPLWVSPWLSSEWCAGPAHQDATERPSRAEARASGREAFRQTPHLPEGWVQGMNRSVTEHPFFAFRIPIPPPFRDEKISLVAPSPTISLPTGKKTARAIVGASETGGESRR